MRTNAPKPPPPRHHRLMPYERRLADWGARSRARRGPAREGSARWSLEQNYGPEGLALIAAVYANLYPGLVIFLAGVVWLTVGAASAAAGCLLLVGVLILLVAMARGIQGARAGRAYRNGRPFIRARIWGVK